MIVQETIPESFRSEVEAALTWFNQEQEKIFEVTGILDPELLEQDAVEKTIKLILCSGDQCEQRTFNVRKESDRYTVSLVSADLLDRSMESPPAILDPPPGPRRGFLDRALGQHAFVVLVFYRGFW